MNTKLKRLKKIKSFLRSQADPKSITDVYEALVRRLGEDVSRKTIERDLDEMIEARVVSLMPGVPSRFMLVAGVEIELTLSLKELEHILTLLDPDSELAKKIRGYL